MGAQVRGGRKRRVVQSINQHRQAQLLAPVRGRLPKNEVQVLWPREVALDGLEDCARLASREDNVHGVVRVERARVSFFSFFPC